MRPVRLLVPFIPAAILTVPLCLGAATLTACGSSGGKSTSGTGGNGGGASSDCFDYTGFQTTPTVGFAADVLPIFSNSCGISSVCHGCDDSSTCTDSGIKPYLGPAVGSPAATSGQIAAIFAQAVGQPSTLQPSLSDSSMMVGNPGMMIIAPGDPEHSFMMYKLDGDPNATNVNDEVSCSTLSCASGMTCGGSMPSGGPQLSSTDRNTIRRWIAEGAKND
jgi:hypothetical protein